MAEVLKKKKKRSGLISESQAKAWHLLSAPASEGRFYSPGGCVKERTTRRVWLIARTSVLGIGLAEPHTSYALICSPLGPSGPQFTPL